MSNGIFGNLSELNSFNGCVSTIGGNARPSNRPSAIGAVPKRPDKPETKPLVCRRTDSSSESPWK